MGGPQLAVTTFHTLVYVFLTTPACKDNQHLYFIQTKVYQRGKWESGEITLKVTRRNILWEKKIY